MRISTSETGDVRAVVFAATVVPALLLGLVGCAPATQQQGGDMADAVAGYEMVSTDVEASADGFVRESLTCPDGKRVLGGGVQVAGEGSRDFETVLQESAPGTIGGGAEDVWLVALQNEDASAHTVRIKAVCAEAPPGYEMVSTDVEVSAGGFVRESLTCPDGKRVLGGGAQVAGEGSRDFETVLQESAPGTIGGGAEDVWLVALQNEDASAHTVRIKAVCAGTS